MVDGPRILILDIETSPIKAYVWGLWQQNVGLNQIIEPTHVICFAAKWLGDPTTMFFRADQEDLPGCAWELLDQADIVITFNGQSFDLPHLSREFLEAGLPPPSPYKQVDLFLASKKMFRFPSNKLEYISQQLLDHGKVRHEGFDLWVKCEHGDEAAWKLMKKYNKRDVTLLEELYEILLPWIPSHPNLAVYQGERVCPACGQDALVVRKYCYTQVSRFVQFRCSACGKYSRKTHRETGADIASVTL